MASQTQSNKERLKEITDSIEQGIQELFDSEKYRQYLSIMSRFHNYSVNNTMLIYMQRPDATLVAGFQKWKNQFERHVKSGEHGITIIAPTPYRKKVEKAKLDPDTKAPILDAEGKVIFEEKTIEIPLFKPVKVFDISQTDGKPLPHLVSDLTGVVENYDVFLEALRRTSPVPVTLAPIAPDTDGFFNLNTQSITIREGMSEVQTVSALVHEMAHALLHNQKKIVEPKDAPKYQEVEIFDIPALFSNGRIALADLPDGLYRYDLRGSDDDPGMPVTIEPNVAVNHAGTIITAKPLDLGIDDRRYLTENEGLNFVGGEISMQRFFNEQQKSRNTEEVEAESISYAVCQYFGIQTGENSFGYIATWSKGKELKELRESLETINKTANRLITDIEKHFREICEEHGIDLALNGEPDSGEIPDLESAVPRKNVDYRLVSNFQNTGKGESTRVQKYLLSSDASVTPAEILFLGTYEKCLEIQEKLKTGAITEQQAKAMDDAEKLYILSGNTYLHIQRTEDGFDYSLYDKATSKLLDGGQLDGADRHIFSACTEICRQHDLNAYDCAYAPLEVLDLLQAAQEKPMRQVLGENQVEHFALEEGTSEDAVPEQALDQYPLPDPQLSPADLEAYSYLDGDMLPLSRERAMELQEKDFTVYAITSNGEAEMLFDEDDFSNYGDRVIFTVERGEWERSPDFHQQIVDRLKNQPQREQAFLQHRANCFAIYQQKLDSPGRFRSFHEQKDGIQRKGYDLVYTGELPNDLDANAHLESLWYKFNTEHPADYHSPSLSVSDIIALNLGGVVSCHYVDSIGYQDVPNFLESENYLKNAEMLLEDDYNMIDGIINNGPKEPLSEVLPEPKKKSVMAQLKAQPTKPHKKQAQKRSAEQEL